MWKTTSLLASGLALASAGSRGAPSDSMRDLKLSDLNARILDLERAAVSRELWADPRDDGGELARNLADAGIDYDVPLDDQAWGGRDAPGDYGAPASRELDTALDEIKRSINEAKDEEAYKAAKAKYSKLYSKKATGKK